jgi:hypothetical protein
MTKREEHAVGSVIRASAEAERTGVRPTLATRAPRMTIHHANADVVIGWWECVLISIWRRDQGPEYARMRGIAGELLAKQRPGPLALLTVVLESAGLPDDPTRIALAKLRLTPSHQHVVACAGVAEGGPLRVAGARAVSISLDQIVPPPFPTRMFGDRADAVLWLMEALTRAGVTALNGRDLMAAIAPSALPTRT